MVIFGGFVACTIGLVMLWHKINMRERDWTVLIGEEKQPH